MKDRVTREFFVKGFSSQEVAGKFVDAVSTNGFHEGTLDTVLDEDEVGLIKIGDLADELRADEAYLSAGAGEFGAIYAGWSTDQVNDSVLAQFDEYVQALGPTEMKYASRYEQTDDDGPPPIGGAA